jgi:hypothetical protein
MLSLNIALVLTVESILVLCSEYVYKTNPKTSKLVTEYDHICCVISVAQ